MLVFYWSHHSVAFSLKGVNEFDNVIVTVAPPRGHQTKPVSEDEVLRTDELLASSRQSSSWFVEFISKRPCFFSFSLSLSSIEDYELIMDSDILPNRTTGSGWTTGALDIQEPAQFEERHLIFLQLLGKVQTSFFFSRNYAFFFFSNCRFASPFKT